MSADVPRRVSQHNSQMGSPARKLPITLVLSPSGTGETAPAAPSRRSQPRSAPRSAAVTTRCRCATRPRRTPVGVTAGLEGFIALSPRFGSVWSRPVLTPSGRAARDGALLSAALDLPVWPAPGAVTARGVVRLVGAAVPRHPDGRPLPAWDEAHDHRSVAATSQDLLDST
jgi:hypothetical protein